LIEQSSNLDMSVKPELANYTLSFQSCSAATYKSHIQRQLTMTGAELRSIEVAQEDNVLHAKPHYIDDLKAIMSVETNKKNLIHRQYVLF